MPIAKHLVFSINGLVLLLGNAARAQSAGMTAEVNAAYPKAYAMCGKLRRSTRRAF